MKIVGIILICIQVLAFVGGEGLLGMGIVGLAVFCLPGIIGIILLVKSKKKSNGNEPKLNFNEFVSSLSNEQRANVLRYCEKFGDANQVLRNLLDTPSCYQTQKDEYRINKDFLLWHFIYNSKKYYKIIKIDSIAYCYQSSDEKRSIVGLIYEDWSNYEFNNLEEKASVVIFAELNRYIHGFENIQADALININQDIVLPSPYVDVGECYVLKGYLLYKVIKSTFLSSEDVIISDIRTIVWCRQGNLYDLESTDSAYLEVYLCNKKNPVKIYTDKEINAFKIAMILKRRVPHLMYGPNKTYEEIFKRNPAELMDLAKSKMNSPQDK